MFVSVKLTSACSSSVSTPVWSKNPPKTPPAMLSLPGPPESVSSSRPPVSVSFPPAPTNVTGATAQMKSQGPLLVEASESSWFVPMTFSTDGLTLSPGRRAGISAGRVVPVVAVVCDPVQGHRYTRADETWAVRVVEVVDVRGEVGGVEPAAAVDCVGAIAAV